MLLNVDAGEYENESEELWALADVVSIACGGHAGDERSMTRIVEFCARRGGRPAIGAHPSYPDREGFGRRSIRIDFDSLRASIAEQCWSLATIAAALGQRVQYIKPHGALYHDAQRQLPIAGAVMWGANDALGTDLTVIGPDGKYLAQVARAQGPHGTLARGFLREGFADRATQADGSLVPRSEPGALITDPQQAAARARELAGKVDTICVHADTPGALEIARAVREALRG